MVFSASTKFLQVSQSQSVLFSDFIHFGSRRLLHCLQNNDIVICICSSICTGVNREIERMCHPNEENKSPVHIVC